MLRGAVLGGAMAAVLTGCAAFMGDAAKEPPTRSLAETPAAPAPAPAPAATPPAPPPPPPKPFPAAVASAAEGLFGNAAKNLAATPRQPRYPVMIDPLVDGVTGAETTASRSMGEMLAEEIRANWPQFELLEFTSENVAKAPLVLVGTFTGLNAEKKPIGPRETYRICLSLADLSSGKVVAKGLAFALKDGVDVSPAPFVRESPAWRNDARTEGYIKTCQGPKAGDPIHPAYLEGILAAAFIADGIQAYEAGRLQEARQLYESARQTQAGDQLRVYNGLYLTNWHLGQRDAAAQAFGDIVDYGLRHEQLAVKLLFKPGSTAFVPDARLSEPYPMWLDVIAERAATSKSCLEVTGHTSPTGPAALNERLSLLRAENVRGQLVRTEPSLEGRTIANGVGSKENIIGTGTDDAVDALDRRVEFAAIPC